MRERSVDEAVVLFAEMKCLRPSWQKYRPIKNGAEI